jgi:tetratricopeptide (TPR) repeat protein
LGIIAEVQRDYTMAERWYKQSLAIFEKHGDEHRAAASYNQLGQVSRSQYAYQDAVIWYLKALSVFLRYQDNHNFMIVASNYALAVQAADLSTQAILCQRWTEAGFDQIITLNQLEQKLNDNA